MSEDARDPAKRWAVVCLRHDRIEKIFAYYGDEKSAMTAAAKMCANSLAADVIDLWQPRLELAPR